MSEKTPLTWQTYLWKLFRRSFHGTLRFLEVGEAALATLMYCLAYFFTGLEHFFHAAFVIFACLLFITFLFGIFFAAYLFARESDQDASDLKAQLSKKKSEGEIRQEQKQKYEKQIARLRTEEIAALRRMLEKGKMTFQDFKQCSEDEKLDYVDTAHLMTGLPSVRRDPADGSCNIDPSARDFIAEILDP